MHKERYGEDMTDRPNTALIPIAIGLAALIRALVLRAGVYSLASNGRVRLVKRSHCGDYVVQMAHLPSLPHRRICTTQSAPSSPMSLRSDCLEPVALGVTIFPHRFAAPDRIAHQARARRCVDRIDFVRSVGFYGRRHIGACAHLSYDDRGDRGRERKAACADEGGHVIDRMKLHV